VCRPADIVHLRYLGDVREPELVELVPRDVHAEVGISTRAFSRCDAATGSGSDRSGDA
jgi:hypothetical protein